jgi:CRP/FNR family transcriptional regulator, cyclic AMP receptor protein
MDFGTTFTNAMNHMGWPEVFGFLGAVFYIATHWMKTMVPLRILGITSNIFLLTYATLHASYPSILLYASLIPINGLRLVQMLKLVRQVEVAAQGDLNMDWLKPFMSKRTYQAGEILFRRGDRAEEMFYTVSGRFRLIESGITIEPGQVVGELGLLAPENRRTQSLECVESATVLVISYEKVRELYFQNPKFGFFFLRLISERMFQNIDRLEARLEAQKRAAAEAAPQKA